MYIFFATLFRDVYASHLEHEDVSQDVDMVREIVSNMVQWSAVWGTVNS